MGTWLERTSTKAKAWTAIGVFFAMLFSFLGYMGVSFPTYARADTVTALQKSVEGMIWLQTQSMIDIRDAEIRSIQRMYPSGVPMEAQLTIDRIRLEIKALKEK